MTFEPYNFKLLQFWQQSYSLIIRVLLNPAIFFSLYHHKQRQTSPDTHAVVSWFQSYPVFWILSVFFWVWLWFADVSEHSICSIFKGWMWSMVSDRRTWYLYRSRGLLELVGPIGRGHQVVGGSEWVSRCGGGRYKRRVSGCSPVGQPYNYCTKACSIANAMEHAINYI